MVKDRSPGTRRGKEDRHGDVMASLLTGAATNAAGVFLDRSQRNVKRSVWLRRDDSQGLHRIAGGEDHKLAGLGKGDAAHVPAEQIN